MVAVTKQFPRAGAACERTCRARQHRRGPRASARSTAARSRRCRTSISTSRRRADHAAGADRLRQDHAAEDHRRACWSRPPARCWSRAAVTGPGPERAFVFQDFALMPWATVLRNVAFGLELRGMAEAERQEIARALHRARSASPASRTSIRTSCRAACASASAWPARWRSTPTCCCWTSRSPRSTSRRGASSRRTCCACARSSARPSSSSPTASRRRSTSPTGSCCCRAGPGRVSQIIEPQIDRSGSPDEIRRDQAYLDTVEEIWQGLQQLRGLRRADDPVRLPPADDGLAPPVVPGVGDRRPRSSWCSCSRRFSAVLVASWSSWCRRRSS